MVLNMEIVVVFPAPFGPKNPNNDPDYEGDMVWYSLPLPLDIFYDLGVMARDIKDAYKGSFFDRLRNPDFSLKKYLARK